MNIRTFALEDTEAVVELWRECELLVPWNNPYKDIERKLKVDSELFLVGEINHNLVASAMGGYDGHRGWVNYLAVSPKNRNNRLGQQIMHALESLLLQRGCPKVNLQIRSTNSAVINFYKNLGYKTESVASMGKRLVSDDI